MKLFFVMVICFITCFSQSEKTKVYLDVVVLNDDLIKEHIKYVDYVRDQHQADVILFMRREGAANGGNYLIEIRGQKAFEGQNYKFSYFSANVETDKKRNDEVLRLMSFGLMPFILDTKVVKNLSFTYDHATENDTAETKTKIVDPWDNWVFETGFRFSLRENKSTKNENFGFDFEAERVTEDLKLEFNTDINRSESTNVLSDTTYVDVSRRRYVGASAVFSIFDKFSAGLFSSYNTSTFGNIESSISVMPAIEYSLFPYSESSKRYIRAVYRVGSKWNEYDELTIFNKIDEQLYQHRFAIRGRFTEVWGSANLNISYSSYLHDQELNRFSVSSNVNIKLVEGLSFRLNGFYEKTKDQITLPKGEQSDEDLLRGIRERESDFNYYFSFGLSYTFGSIYNSIVNPRL